MSDGDEKLSVAQAAKESGLQYKSMLRRIANGTGPKVIRPTGSKKIIIRRFDLDRWHESLPPESSEQRTLRLFSYSTTGSLREALESNGNITAGVPDDAEMTESDHDSE